MIKEPLDILMVEDDREQAELIMDTARVCSSPIRWRLLEDGQSALSLLRKQAGFDESKRPALVLLDLHLPKLSGAEVLREIKEDPTLRGLPVVMMSSSRAQPDIDAAYALGANCYIAKPASFEGLCGLIRFLEAFISLPPAAASGEGSASPAHTRN